MMLALVLFGSVPVIAVFLNSRYLFRRRELAKLACLLAVAGLLVASLSCGRPLPGVGSATNPTPTASAPVQPTPTC